MPRRRKYRKRRNYKKSRGFLKTSGGGLTPSFPLSKTYKFRTQYITPDLVLDSGLGGAPDTHVYSLNGLYDPDVTGVGHQPLGFDQIMPMYDHYTVIGARVRVTASNSDPTYAQRVILSIRDTATVSTALTNILENGMNRWLTLPQRDAGGSTRTLSINCSPSKFFGRKVLQDDKYQGTIITNPADQVYLHLTISPASSGADAAPVHCTVQIQYIAILTEPKMLQLS